MKKYLSGLVFLSIGMAVALPQAIAENTADLKKHAAKPVSANSEKQAAAEDIHTGMVGFSGKDFHCELGSKLTIYENSSEANRIGLRWNKQMHELTRVETSTGANRFEDQKNGLVWISIPSKGMLLDSKKGQQLANECKTPDQMMTRKKI